MPPLPGPFVDALLKTQKQSLFYGVLQTNRRDWIKRFYQNEKKIHLRSTCCSFEKKNSRLFRLYSDLEICWANFKTLSRIQISARALTIGFMSKTTVPYAHHFFGTFLWRSLRAPSPCKDICVNFTCNWTNGSTCPPQDALRKMPGSYSQPSWVILKEPRAVGRWN